MNSVQGNLVDIHNQTIFPVEIILEDGKIKSIVKLNTSVKGFIVPPFIDSHIHIESSLLVPACFADVALRHGTVATISDPHEIANVCGIDGVKFMIDSGEKSSLKFFWTAPSCVPATSFETSGANFEAEELRFLLEKSQVVALGEMMNYPGVIYKDKAVLDKCRIAKENYKVIDGHAPGVSGFDLISYVSAGISTDHECSTLDEALEKIALGMKILIREGSSAKNFEALYLLLLTNPDDVMLCSDDLNAEDLTKGHINLLIKKSLAKGIPLFNVLRAVSLNPVKHYNLPVGLLRVGDLADFVIVDNLNEFNIKETWVNGVVVYKEGEGSLHKNTGDIINNFNCSFVSKTELAFKVTGSRAKVMVVEEGSIATKSLAMNIGADFNSFLKKNNILKLYVKDRYKNVSLGKGLVMGFGAFHGAIASTIAHDSHNIIAIGDSIDDVKKAINLLIEKEGGISFVSGDDVAFLPLPVAGLMSNERAEIVAEKHETIIKLAEKHGCLLKSPLMTLSFLALLVIPSLKLSDKGLFDVDTFNFTDLFIS